MLGATGATAATLAAARNGLKQARGQCAPLTLTGGSDGLGDGGYTLHVATDLTLPAQLRINLFEGGTRIGPTGCATTATGTSCTQGVEPGGYSADIGEANVTPGSRQALASASVVIRPIKPTCTKSTCP